MNRNLSLYLDLVRFSAAMTVLVSHLSAQALTAGLFWQTGVFADDAVVVFFVLSGFVISWVTQTRETSAADYAVARAARIYSVAVPAVLLTFALDAVGTAIDPVFYAPDLPERMRPLWWEFVSSLTFLNQIWYFSTDIGSMLPYWSLGYEVWYYVLFGVALFVRNRRHATLALALILLFVGPRIAVLLPLWLLGVGVQRWLARTPVSVRAGLLAYGASVLAFVLFALEGRAWLMAHDSVSPWVGEKMVVVRYAVALIFALHLVGAAGLSRLALQPGRRVEQLVRRFAGTTFTVYLVHLPVARFLVALSPWPHTSASHRLMVFGGTFLAIALVAQVSEHRKNWWSALFRRWLVRRSLQPS